MIVWSTLYLEYFEDLVYLRVANEQCLSLRHLCVNAPNAPNVNGCGVFFGPQEDFWCAVPQGYDFVGVCFDGKSEGSCQPEVSEFDIAVLVNEKILGLKVSVHHTVGVAVGSCL